MRVATPIEAISAGADMLVIGRMVTEAENPIEASVIPRTILRPSSSPIWDINEAKRSRRLQ